MPQTMHWDIDNNVLTATRQDPYGFWVFSFKRGQIPRVLEGTFTTESRVISAAESYIANRKGA